MKFTLEKIENESNNQLIWMYKDCEVTNVVKKSSVGIWTGELNDEYYFRVEIIQFVVYISISDRELRTVNLQPIAKINIDWGFTEKTNVFQYGSMILDFFKTFSFEEVMKLFNWKYASSKVEMFDYTIN